MSNFFWRLWIEVKLRVFLAIELLLMQLLNLLSPRMCARIMFDKGRDILDTFNRRGR